MTTETAKRQSANTSEKRLLLFQRLGLVFLALLYFLRSGHPTLQTALGDDNATYLLTAQAIASGHGYRMINQPDMPPAAFYPVGYPLLLSPVFALLGTGSSAMWAAKLLSGAFCLLFVWLTYRFLRFYLRPEAASLGALVVGVEPLTVMMSGEVMAECAFASFFMAGMVFFLKTQQAQTETSGWIRAAFVSGLFVGAAMVVRTVGFTLIAAGIATLFWQGKRRESAFFLGGAVFCEIPWQLWTMTHKSNSFSGYGSELLHDYTWRTPLQNLWSLLTYSVPVSVFPGLQTRAVEQTMHNLHLGFFMPAFGLMMGAVLLLGWFHLLKQKNVAAVCIAFYFGVILFWPWEPSRFVMPLYPLLLVAFVRGMGWCADAWKASERGRQNEKSPGKSRTQTLAWAGAAVCLVAALGVDAMRLQMVRRYDNWNGAEVRAEWDDYQEAFAWIKQNTPPDAILVSNYSVSLFLLTGRSSANVDSTGTHLAAAVERAKTWNRPVYVVGFRRVHPVTQVEFGLSPAEALAQSGPQQKTRPLLEKVWSSGGRTVGIFKAQGAEAAAATATTAGTTVH